MSSFNTPSYCSLKEAFKTSFLVENDEQYEQHYKKNTNSPSSYFPIKQEQTKDVYCSSFIDHYQSCLECSSFINSMVLESNPVKVPETTIEHFSKKNIEVNDIILWVAIILILWILFFNY